MTIIRAKIGPAIVEPHAPRPIPTPELICTVTRWNPHAGPKIDYVAFRNDVTRGTLSSRQIKAAAARAARKTAKVAVVQEAPQRAS